MGEIVGFFGDHLSDELKRKKKRGRIPDCFTCGLYRKCKSPKMEPFGEGRKKIMIIGEAPGAQEDLNGMPFAGTSGQYLRRVLGEYGIHLDRDCWRTNAIQCHPEGNRNPTDHELESCRHRVIRQIKELKPEKILLLGGYAVKSVIGNRYVKAKAAIQNWRAFTIPDAELGCWLYSTYHPAAIFHDRKESAMQTIFLQDVAEFVSLDPPKPDDFRDLEEDRKRVKILQDPHSILDLLQEIIRNPPKSLFSFDYETTGLKPYAKGHKIVCAGFCYSEDDVYCFWFPDNPRSRVHLLWKRVLKESKIKKSAHHMKFEEMWSMECVGTNVEGWDWCSMEGTHVLDNRSGITGLKFQVYVNFGIAEYDSHITKYLSSDEDEDEESANDFNRILEAPRREVMIYCGLDSFYQYLLAVKQTRELRSLLE